MGTSLGQANTEFIANQITLLRGLPTDIVSVGVYHDIDPHTEPAVGDFTSVILDVSGDKPDIQSLIGPRNGDAVLAPGDYQRWVIVSTSVEDVIRKVDVVSVV